MCSNLTVSDRKLPYFVAVPEYLSFALFRRTSICRGAVFKGFLDGPSVGLGGKQKFELQSQVSVVSTFARMSVGVSYDPLFKVGVHPEEDKFWDDYHGEYFARNQMMWYLRKVRKFNNDTNRRETCLC